MEDDLRAELLWPVVENGCPFGSSRFDDLKRFSKSLLRQLEFSNFKMTSPFAFAEIKNDFWEGNSCFYKRELLYFLVNYTIREESSRAEQQTVVAFFEVQPELKPNLSNYILGQFFSTFGPHKYEE